LLVPEQSARPVSERFGPPRGTQWTKPPDVLGGFFSLSGRAHFAPGTPLPLRSAHNRDRRIPEQQSATSMVTRWIAPCEGYGQTHPSDQPAARKPSQFQHKLRGSSHQQLSRGRTLAGVHAIRSSGSRRRRTWSATPKRYTQCLMEWSRAWFAQTQRLKAASPGPRGGTNSTAATVPPGVRAACTLCSNDLLVDPSK